MYIWSLVLQRLTLDRSDSGFLGFGNTHFWFVFVAFVLLVLGLLVKGL